MRILSDFDGVLTAQDGEAEAVGVRLAERVTEVLGDAVRAQAILAGLRAEVRAEPGTHGWFVGDEIACYADEDPYVFHVATAFAIFRQGPEELRERLRAAGIDGPETLAQRNFDEGTARYRAGHPSHVLTEAAGAIQSFFAAGAEVVIVSNSARERIEGILAPTGLLRWGAGKIRIRGGAKKFALTSDRPKDVPATADMGGRTVRLRRGLYFDVLVEEQPDVVIGDVLSLDLALPAALRAAGGDFEETDLILKRHPGTPRWALEACAARGIQVVDSVARVPALLRV